MEIWEPERTLQPSGPAQACTGIVLRFTLFGTSLQRITRSVTENINFAGHISLLPHTINDAEYELSDFGKSLEVCLKISALNQVQKGAAKFANNINESSWGTLAQCRLIARICALFKAYTGRRA